MRKYLRISLLTAIIACMCAVSGQADGRHGGHHGGGSPGWWPVVGLGLGLGMWELSRPYYAYPTYYSAPPVIIQQQPQEVYIQPAPQYVPAQPATEQYYWYFCKEANGYYPYVKECPQGWMKVVPTPPVPQGTTQPSAK